MNLVAASRSANWQISEESCFTLSDSLTSLDVMTINKTVSFDRIFLLIWPIAVSFLKLLRLITGESLEKAVVLVV